MTKNLTADQIDKMISEDPNQGFDTCATCDSVYEYGTMKETSQESFDLICDDCIETSKNNTYDRRGKKGSYQSS